MGLQPHGWQVVFANDISEKKNVADVNREKAGELHGMLKRWRKSVKAPVPDEANPDYRP